jgi:hypothetical protein
MNYSHLSEYNIKILRFEEFFNSIQSILINELYDFKLIDDNSLKNIDTKKIFQKKLIEEILKTFSSSKNTVFFLVKGDLVDKNDEFFSFYSYKKVKQQINLCINHLKKNNFNNFLFLNEDLENVEDFIKIHLLKNSFKRIIDKEDKSFLLKSLLETLK